MGGGFRFFVVYLLLIIYWMHFSLALMIKWKSVTCESGNKNIVTFRYCYVKPYTRDNSLANIYANIIQRPINNFEVNVDLRKRLNGWKPFLYNYTIDACKYLSNPKRYPIANYLYHLSGISAHSNVNHSCPYNHDMMLQNHSFADSIEVMQHLPIPGGDYAAFLTSRTNSMDMFRIKMYIEVKE